MKIEISVVNMPDTAAATVVGEIENLVTGYIVGKGLKRYVKIEGGK
jgi:hypothetical protein